MTGHHSWVGNAAESARKRADIDLPYQVLLSRYRESKVQQSSLMGSSSTKTMLDGWRV
jgi:hypothetical protein